MTPNFIAHVRTLCLLLAFSVLAQTPGTAATSNASTSPADAVTPAAVKHPAAALQAVPHALKPLVIAHRGASGYTPEHSQRAYELALLQGADVVELDLVVSRDRQLLVRHENELSHSTNVAQLPQFASRKTKKRVDGIWQEGWFAEDFTLAELKQLHLRETKANERPANVAQNDRYALLSLADVLAWNATQWQQGRRFQLYMELKHPSFFRHEAAPFQADIAALLLTQLQQQPLPAGQRLFIESFEATPLQFLATQRATLPFPVTLVQLIGDTSGQSTLPNDNFSYPWDEVLASGLLPASDAASAAGVSAAAGMGNAAGAGHVTGESKAALPTYDQMVTPEGLAKVRQYADAIGPWRDNIYPYAGGPVAPWLALAKQLGLQVHPYTYRAEASFLQQHPNGQRISMCQELQWLFSLQLIDGVFADQPDVAIQARDGQCPR